MIPVAGCLSAELFVWNTYGIDEVIDGRSPTKIEITSAFSVEIIGAEYPLS